MYMFDEQSGSKESWQRESGTHAKCQNLNFTIFRFVINVTQHAQLHVSALFLAIIYFPRSHNFHEMENNNKEKWKENVNGKGGYKQTSDEISFSFFFSRPISLSLSRSPSLDK